MLLGMACSVCMRLLVKIPILAALRHGDAPVEAVVTLHEFEDVGVIGTEHVTHAEATDTCLTPSAYTATERE
jgi:hypothetical protein